MLRARVRRYVNGIPIFPKCFFRGTLHGSRAMQNISSRGEYIEIVCYSRNILYIVRVNTKNGVTYCLLPSPIVQRSLLTCEMSSCNGERIVGGATGVYLIEATSLIDVGVSKKNISKGARKSLRKQRANGVILLASTKLP
ncbi:hypothetical protein DBV15_10939 [Temnothorax longispinosus]|uniref:Uncharacterized protein n=1 Tax=Temnothorax longispinosus TaxID=300112 RepID=A0A4S2KC79_9HYME|nr:hypothetical protein DBV15_10939 [Temnothorax longispinosus]